MTSLRSELSSVPVPDWQRRREQRPTVRVVWHQPFEAPYRSLMRGKSGVQSAAREWARHAIEIVELNRARFRPARSAEAFPTPPWVLATTTLPSLSARSVGKWIATVNAMIRDQLPYFQLHPDWRSGDHSDAVNSPAQGQILRQIDREVRQLAGIR